MHNVKRVPQATLSPEYLARRKEEEQKKLTAYKNVENEYLARVCMHLLRPARCGGYFYGRAGKHYGSLDMQS